MKHLESFATRLISFAWAKQRYYRNCKSDESKAPNIVQFQQLMQNGLVQIEGFLTSAEVRAFLQAIPNREQLEAHAKVHPQASLYLVEEAHRLSEHFRSFFENAWIRSFAEAYLGSKAVSFRRTLNLKLDPNRLTSFGFEGFYHMDDWKHRFKAFLYLTDVGPEEAPLIYLKQSHYGWWRLLAEAQLYHRYQATNRGYATNPATAYLGCYFPHEIAELQERYSFQEHACTGPAGTLILFDARGLHRGSELKQNQRIVLVDHWTVPQPRFQAKI